MAEAYWDETKLQAVFEELKRAKKQELLLVSFLDLSHTLNPALSKELSKKELLERSGYTSAVLEGLLETGYLGELRERGGSFTSIRLPLARAESAQSGARESLRRDP